MSRYGHRYNDQWAPYVPVAKRKQLAEKKAKRRLKKGQSLAPIRITGRKIATTFWGTAWCDNLEHYSDFSNRLPRGRTYARNGSIVDLQINTGKIAALVAGSSPYDVKITIKKLDAKRWTRLQEQCAESIHSLIDLMRGKLPDDALRRLTDPKNGMFPSPREIRLSCNCPDGASLCKHLAAVLYGVGHRLDSEPDLFFRLRGVNQHDLISESLSTSSVDAALGLDQESAIDSGDLESIFGIDLAGNDTDATSKPTKKQTRTNRSSKSPKKTAKKKNVTQKRVAKKAATAAKANTEPQKLKAAKKKAKVARKKKAKVANKNPKVVAKKKSKIATKKPKVAAKKRKATKKRKRVTIDS